MGGFQSLFELLQTLGSDGSVRRLQLTDPSSVADRLETMILRDLSNLRPGLVVARPDEVQPVDAHFFGSTTNVDDIHFLQRPRRIHQCVKIHGETEIRLLFNG